MTTALSYNTREGDTVDLLAWRYYQSTDNRIVERLLVANPGLADYGPILPAGVTVALPELDVPATQEGITLWQ
ncbi:MAG: tail protein X [Salinisphaera sp.]|jgi:phage tail protein X|nr:tail protein X [Salinisphaera sp.]